MERGQFIITHTHRAKRYAGPPEREKHPITQGVSQTPFKTYSKGPIGPRSFHRGWQKRQGPHHDSAMIRQAGPPDSMPHAYLIGIRADFSRRSLGFGIDTVKTPLSKLALALSGSAEKGSRTLREKAP
jgi:hypothetical protein